MLTLWLTGLPGSGKSTIAGLVAQQLRARGAAVEILDGDSVRRHLSPDLGYGPEDRERHADRVSFVANLLSRNNVIAIVALISPYRSSRERARFLIGDRFVEIHVHASLDECIRRDPKGLYKRALHGEQTEFTGVSAPYEPPDNPELLLDTEIETPGESARRVIELLDTWGANRR